MKKNIYENDITEVVAILDSGYSSDCEIDKEKIDIVLKKISKKMDDDFLNERADLLKANIVNTNKTKKQICDLYNKYCNKEKCNECLLNKYCNTYIQNRIENYDKKAPVMIDQTTPNMIRDNIAKNLIIAEI